LQINESFPFELNWPSAPLIHFMYIIICCICYNR